MTVQLLYTAAAGFEAARMLEGLPAGHASLRLHGHGFKASVRAALPDDYAAFDGGAADALLDRLKHCVAPLDYNSLNSYLTNPTDEHLARWIRQELAVPGVRMTGVQSTAQQGVDLDADGSAHVWRRYRFEAAHQLPHVPPGHQCGRMHGHGFDVILHVRRDPNQQQSEIDYDRLDRHWAPIHQQLNHACLNDIAGLDNPTSEILAAWIWDKLAVQVQQLSWVTVYETATAGCHFNGVDYRIWKEQRFESALCLQQAPGGDPRRLLHGHSYLLRLHLSTSLDPLMGWTIDYGDVKQRFAPIYQRLDHHRLDQLEGLQQPDPARLAHWIFQQAEPNLPELDRIDVYQMPGSGVILQRDDGNPALPV